MADSERMKLPFIQFFPADWLMKTRPLSLATKGAWIDILCILHNSATRGSVAMSVAGWARVIGATLDQVEAVISELAETRVADVTRGSNGDVTIESRRMREEQLTREQTRRRVAKHRVKSVDAPSNAPSTVTGNAACIVSGNGAVTDIRRSQKEKEKEKEKENTETTSPSCPKSGKPTPDEGEIETKEPPPPKPPKKPRERNQLLDALARIEGSDPVQVTPLAWGRIAKALSEIRQVAPDVTVEAIEERVRKYAKVMPQGSKVTANALAMHWAKCSSVPTLFDAPTSDIYTEPFGWQERAERLWPDAEIPKTWFALSSTARLDLIK